MKPVIYMDHAAATPLDPRVFKVMEPYFKTFYGNPSSIYEFAQKSRHAVEDSRKKTADILDVKEKEIFFTSGGTESNNFLIFGIADAHKDQGKHIVTISIEHDSILKPLEHLEKNGFEITRVKVQKNGIVKTEDVLAAIRKDTILVTVMYANNEIGTIQPIAEIGMAIKEIRDKGRYPIFHTDACQAASYLDLNTKKLNVDSMTLNGGKIYGPKGVGVLFLKENISITPQIWGGGQERRLRSGTENVPVIVGFAEALTIVTQNREEESKRLVPLRDELIAGLLKTPDTILNGDPTTRLPNNVNVSFKGIEGESILLRLDMIGVAVSSGSACTSGSLEPSHVIRSLGLGEVWTHSSTRFSLGQGNTKKEVDFVLEQMPKIIEEVRELSPFV